MMAMPATNASFPQRAKPIAEDNGATDFKTFPTIEDIALPEPGLGEVLLKVAGAGACHSEGRCSTSSRPTRTTV